MCPVTMAHGTHDQGRKRREANAQDSGGTIQVHTVVELPQLLRRVSLKPLLCRAHGRERTLAQRHRVQIEKSKGKVLCAGRGPGFVLGPWQGNAEGQEMELGPALEESRGRDEALDVREDA